MKDLRRDRGALNVPWVVSPFFDSLVEDPSLSEADRALARRYRSDGYAVIEQPVADEATLDRILTDLEGRYDDAATGYSESSRRLDAWRFSPAVAALARSPSVLAALRTLYAREPIPFQTLNFRRGTQQAAHSDTIHFHSIPQHFMAGVWVALEDVHPSSGPLRVYPGSHRLPVLDLFDLGIATGFENYREYEAVLGEIVAAEGLQPHDLPIRRGQAVIWAANLLHGGSPVADPARTRLSQVTHYYFEGCAYYQPAASDPFVGRIALKSIEEIGTGRIVPNLYRSRPIEEWLPKAPAGLWDRLFR